jgi:hypothetical protein
MASWFGGNMQAEFLEFRRGLSGSFAMPNTMLTLTGFSKLSAF